LAVIILLVYQVLMMPVLVKTVELGLEIETDFLRGFFMATICVSEVQLKLSLFPVFKRYLAGSKLSESRLAFYGIKELFSAFINRIKLFDI
jgi:hypothetical protein